MPDKYYITPNGKRVSETELVRQYGKVKADEFISKGLAKLETSPDPQQAVATGNSDFYATPNGNILSKDELFKQYGEKTEQFISQGLAKPVKKKESSTGSSTSTTDSNTPIPISPLQSNGGVGLSILNPVNSINAGTIKVAGKPVSITHAPVPIDADAKEYAEGLQERINLKLFTPEDVDVVAKSMKVTPLAASAFMANKPKTGVVIQLNDVKEKYQDALQSTIAKANADLKREDDFSTVLASPESISSYISQIEDLYAKKAEQEFNALNDTPQNREAKKQGMKPIPYLVNKALGLEAEEGENFIDKTTPRGAAIYQKIQKSNGEVAGKLKSILGNGILEKVYSDETLTKDQKVEKISKLIDPRQYKNNKSAIAERLDPVNYLVDLAMGGDTPDQINTLNSVKGHVELGVNQKLGERIVYNNALAGSLIEELNDKIANEGLTDPEKIKEYNDKIEEIKLQNDVLKRDYEPTEKVFEKYPVLYKENVIGALNDYNALTSGNIEGVEKQDISRDEYLRNKGFDPNDQRVQDAINSNNLKDYSLFGKPLTAIIDVFKSAGKSTLDIIGVRDELDVLSEKKEAELFPTTVGEKDEFQLTKTASTLQNIGNTTGQVLGQGLLQLGTMNIGRMAGLSKVAAANTAFWSSGALTSYDQAYKDSYDFIDTDAGRTAYAGLIALSNAASEKIFQESKIFNIPGVKDAAANIAGKIGSKEFTQELATEVLSKAKNQFVDYATKYATNVGQEVIEEVATDLFESGARLLFGDPNIDMDAAIESAKTTAIQTALGTSLIAGFGARADIKREKNMSAKSTIYNAALYHDEAMDAINKGFDENLYSAEERDSKIQMLNTAKNAIRVVGETEKVVGVSLTRPQKELYVANLTAEALLASQKGKNTESLIVKSIDEKIQNLRTEREGILENKIQIDDEGNFIDPNQKQIQLLGTNVTGKKVFSDFDETLWDNKKQALTPLGVELSEKIKSGEINGAEVEILTKRNRTPENIKMIAGTLGVPESSVNAGLNAKGKAMVIDQLPGDKKVFFNDNDEELSAVKTGEKIKVTQESDAIDVDKLWSDKVAEGNLGVVASMPQDDAIKMIAEQAQNVSNGEVSNVADAYKSTVAQFGEPLVKAAIAKHPLESLVTVSEETQQEDVQPDDNIISVNEMIDQVGTYNGQRGSFFVDGKTVVFKVEGNEKEYEVGNIDEVGPQSIKDFGIEQETSVVELNEAGNFVVRGQEYFNNFSDPSAAINTDENGYVVSVNLETADGKKVTFRKNIADDIAYQFHLKEINKDNESRKKFEEFINTDEVTATEINDGAFSEIAQETTDQDNEPVSEVREKITPVQNSEVISDDDYNDFIDSGNVADEIINTIADKIQSQQTLTERERVIFDDKAGRINDILVERQKQGKNGLPFNKDKKDEYITKSGRQRVFMQDGELVVKDIKTGDDVAKATRKKALREYAENFDFTHGEEVTETPADTTTDEDAKKFIVQNSQNPYQIAEIYANEEPQTQSLSDKETKIADYGIEVHEKSLNNFFDRNKMTPAIRKAYVVAESKIRDANQRSSLGVDAQALEMSNHYGVEITPQDIVDFIERFPGGEKEALALIDTEVSVLAEDRFKELTGLTLNHEIANIVVNQKFDLLTKGEQRIAQQDYENEQQLKDEYWKQYEATDGFTKEIPDSKTEQGESSQAADSVEDTETRSDNNTPPVPPTEDATAVNVEVQGSSGIIHALTAETRERNSLPAYEKVSNEQEEWENLAKQRIENGEMGEVLKSIRAGNPPGPVEQKMMGFHIAALEKKAEKSNADEDIQELHRVIQLSDQIGGSDVAKSLVARKGTFIPEDSWGAYIVRDLEAAGTFVLTDEQKAQVKKEHDAFVKADEEYKQNAENLAQAVSKEDAEQVVKKSSTKKRSKKSTEDYKKERQSIVESMREKLRKARGEINAVPVPYLKELITIAPDVAKMVYSYADQGVTKLSEMVDNIHSILKDEIKGIQKEDVQDLIAGVYNQQRTKTELQTLVQDIKDEAKLINKLQKLQEGGEPTTEKTKRERNQNIKKLQDEIKAFKKRNSVRSNSALSDVSEDELPDAKKLLSLQKKNEKEAAEIQEQIDLGNFKPEEKRTPLLEDADVKKRFPKLYEKARESKDKLVKVKVDREVRLLQQEYANRTKWQKIKDYALEVLNVPRTIMSSVDFSAPLRQGIIPTISHPVIAATAFVEMFKQSVSQKRFDRWFYDLRETPEFAIMEKSGLYVADPHNLKLSAKEEMFMNNLAEKIPLVGKLIKGSERAYIAYLNKMRVDLFRQGEAVLLSRGKTLDNDEKAYKVLASYVNNATGRGGFANAEVISPYMNAVFFSPRLIASRLNLMNPLYYAKLVKTSPDVAKMAIGDVAKFITFGLSVLATAYLAGADVEEDPRSSDFGKIKVGNTRYDIWGGFQQYVRFAAQLLSGKGKATSTGKIRDIDGTGPFGENRGNLITRFFRGKLAPVPATATDLITGSTIMGDRIIYKWGGKVKEKEITITDEMKKILMPLVVSDVAEAVKTEGAKALGTVWLPATFGIGVQTYTDKK